MKKILFLVLMIMVSTLWACSGETDEPTEEGPYPDGRYRGVYEDRGEMQISIQFNLEDEVISNVSYRWLYHSGNDYRQMDETSPFWGVKLQHDEIAENLEGRNISELSILHTPEELASDVDTWSGATVRGNKIYSAMNDALNRGSYVPADEDYSIDLGDLPDGRYRGTYGDRGEMQVSIQFTLTDNIVSNVSYRWLYHSGIDYRQIDETSPFWGVKLQHDQIAENLDGKHINDIVGLHTPEELADDVDTWTGATVRGNKIYSAMRDAVNRGLYVPEEDNYSFDFDELEDGRYRGIYGDRGEQQVSIQFTLTDNIISDVSYRWLYHNGNDYRQLDEDHALWGIKLQHDQIADYLNGKDVSAVFELHSPGDFVDDVDSWTGATIRGNKIFSAMLDAINRGLYVPAE